MTVHLVGAGPGPVRLLTRRAAGLLAEADVVVVDRTSTDAVAALAPATAERIYVGRDGDDGAWSTDRIVTLLAARHGRGQTVVRLKAGDPFLASRGAEELLALQALGVPVEVTPGVSAATAAGAASGLAPGSSLTVASGNRDPEGPDVDWAPVAAVDDGRSTVVVLTGRAQQAVIAAGLRSGGRPGTTPAAVVHGAARDDARVVTTTLAEAATTRLRPPATLVVAGRDDADRAQVSASDGGARAHP